MWELRLSNGGAVIDQTMRLGPSAHIMELVKEFQDRGVLTSAADLVYAQPNVLIEDGPNIYRVVWVPLEIKQGDQLDIE